MSQPPSESKTSLRDWAGLALLAVAVCAVGGFAIWQAFGSANPTDFIEDVPNVNWGNLDRAGRRQATRIMNEQQCTCGCGMTVAKCRRDDPTCGYSPIIASRIVEAIAQGKSEGEIVKAAQELVVGGDKPAEDPNFTTRVKLDLGSDLPAVGPEGAPVTLVEFIDYQCPFCERAHATVEKLRENYGAKLRLVFVQNPLEDIHPEALLAAEAALAAGEQGKFLEMHSRLLKHQDLLARPDLTEHARALRLDVSRFDAALDGRRFKSRVEENLKLAKSVGVNGTPHFFVNGRSLSGAQPLNAFTEIVDEELAGTAKPTRFVERAQ